MNKEGGTGDRLADRGQSQRTQGGYLSGLWRLSSFLGNGFSSIYTTAWRRGPPPRGPSGLQTLLPNRRASLTCSPSPSAPHLKSASSRPPRSTFLSASILSCCSSQLDDVLVSRGCCNKSPPTGGLKQQTSIFSQLWRSEVQSQGVGTVGAFLEALREPSLPASGGSHQSLALWTHHPTLPPSSCCRLLCVCLPFSSLLRTCHWILN